MDLIKEIKEIKKQLSKLEKFAEEEKKAKQLTISNIKVGEQFVYGGVCQDKCRVL